GFGEPQTVVEPMAPRYDSRGAVLLGEVGHGPDGVALHLVALGEREVVERPLVPVDVLGPFAGSDGDHLGEVELVVGGMAQQPTGRLEGEWVGDDLPAGGGPADTAAGAPGVAAREGVGR